MQPTTYSQFMASKLIKYQIQAFFTPIITILAILPIASLVAQDHILSQNEITPQYLNPSMIGDFDKKGRISATYNNQLHSIIENTSYKSSRISYDSQKELKERKSLGYGITVISENAGSQNFSLNRMHLGVSYAVHLAEDKNLINLISFGADVGLGRKTINLSSPTSVYNFHPDVSAGLHWRYEKLSKLKLKLGGALFHLNKPVIFSAADFTYALPARTVLHASSEVAISRNFALLAQVEFHEQNFAKNNITRLYGKMNFDNMHQVRYIQLGTWLRSGNGESKFHTVGTGLIVQFNKVNVGFSIEQHQKLNTFGYQFQIGYLFGNRMTKEI